MYQTPVGIKVPIQVHSITVRVVGGNCVFPPEPVLGILNPCELDTYTQHTYMKCCCVALS